MTEAGYKGLQVWQRSMALANNVYKATSKFPTEERYGRQATGEYRHHLCIGRASICELETQIILSNSLGFLDKKVMDLLVDEIQEISRMMATMIGKLK